MSIIKGVPSINVSILPPPLYVTLHAVKNAGKKPSTLSAIGPTYSISNKLGILK